MAIQVLGSDWLSDFANDAHFLHVPFHPFRYDCYQDS